MGCSNCSLKATEPELDNLDELRDSSLKLNAYISISKDDEDRRPELIVPILTIEHLRGVPFYHRLNSQQKAVVFRYRYYMMTKDGANATNLAHVLSSADLKRADHRDEVH